MQPTVLVVISANSEWRVVRAAYATCSIQAGPFGEWFVTEINDQQILFLHGGWGKIAAAASTQYAVQRWQPELVVNLGTCGGFAGSVERGTILLATETLVYDIIEQMGDPHTAIDHYTTRLDLSWLQQPYPSPVVPALLISADRDILVAEVKNLRGRYHAVAADWESGAIAWVCHRNSVPCLILRGVSDLVSELGGEAYQNQDVFHQGTNLVMENLLEVLPAWLRAAESKMPA
ncbi:MAG TPA: 5'-methylthioadenosine/S-adenosylhomocysteine nucleosidase [Longilinea sp.]|nr:5'-methylthioadenosine/S-adenosylhomocysteine nucleosidase [Longilinea sp.]